MLLWFFKIKASLWRVGGGKGLHSWKGEQKRGEERRGSQTYFYVQFVKKIVWFFKQQIELFLISCLAVAKSFLYEKGVDIFLHFFYDL